MSGQAHIDSLRFAQERKRLEGRFEVAALPRLHDVLFDQSGYVAYTVIGTVDRRGKPALDVSINGELRLVCQRCLGPLPYRFSRGTRLVLYRSGEPMPDVSAEEPDSEAVSAESISDISDLVEQEAILELPMAVVHDDAPCVDEALQDTQARRESPFMVLQSLKG